MSFKEEIEKSNDPMVIKIKEYLFSRNDVSKLLEKSDKNIEDCILYVNYAVFNKFINPKIKHHSHKMERNWESTHVDESFVYSSVMHYLDEDINMSMIKKEMESIIVGTPNQNAINDNSSLIRESIEKEYQQKFESEIEQAKRDAAAEVKKEIQEERQKKKEEQEARKKEKELEKELKKKQEQRQMSLF
jgi:hypothetical protein